MMSQTLHFSLKILFLLQSFQYLVKAQPGDAFILSSENISRLISLITLMLCNSIVMENRTTKLLWRKQTKPHLHRNNVCMHRRLNSGPDFVLTEASWSGVFMNGASCYVKWMVSNGGENILERTGAAFVLIKKTHSFQNSNAFCKI